MSLNVQELVAALPSEMQSETMPQDELSIIYQSLAGKPVPVTRLRRFWAFGTLQAKIALAYLAYWVRSGYATPEARAQSLNETRLRAALHLVSTMGYLRGVAIKIGQTMANYPNVLVAELADALGQMNFEAPPMHFALLREMVRNELGADPEDLFAEFDTQACAAASLGQVHRARLKSGELVAVKIQYPGIARTIDSDISSLLAIMSPMRLTRAWDSLRAQWQDIHQMLLLEADYRREAANLRKARSVFRDDEGIVIPAPYEQYSSERVLTMEWLDGVHLDDYLSTHRSQAERDRMGTLMMRASFRIAHAARLWYADSNPGNYLFLRDGRFGVIDFGCCREFTSDEWDYYCEVGRAHRVGGERLRAALMRGVGATRTDEVSTEHMKLLEDMAHWYSDYLLYDGEWDFGNETFMRTGQELIEQTFRKRYLMTLPVNTWICRQLIGLRALAFKLKARVNMMRLDQEESKGVFN